MNSKKIWFWLSVAVVLVAAILARERFGARPDAGPPKVLPSLKASLVASIQVRPKDQLEIRAERTNDTWHLTRPIVYPAQAASIQGLLAALERLTPAAHITGRERQARPHADEEDGLSPPRATIVVQQPGYQAQIWVGNRTAPGDQVFVQVIGLDGVYVVDADLLKAIPSTPNDWRDTTFVNLKGLAFDRVALTNGQKFLELQRNPTNGLWRLVTPMEARADSARIEDLLQNLQSVRVRQFLPEDPAPDWEALGLQPPELELTLKQATNPVVALQFGKSPTNDADQVYARHRSRATAMTVTKDLLAPWYISSFNEFRDPHLVTLTDPVDAVEIQADDHFEVLRQGTNTWRVLPQNYPADPDLVKELLGALSGLRVAEFVKDVVTPPDLPQYGLASPARRYILKRSGTNAPALTNASSVVVDLEFGTNREDRVFVRRADETSVYAVRLAQYQQLPLAGFQLRERQLWNFSETNVVRATLRQEGRVRQIVRNGPHAWSLAPGSQGVINDLAIEETVRYLGKLKAGAWLGHGAQHRERLVFSDKSHQLTFELKNGEKHTVEFGGALNEETICAAVTLDGEPWFFELPMSLYRYVATYLSVPANP